jgi:DNA-binding transcriptional ArsR family regulator
MSDVLDEVGVLDGALAISALSALAHDARLQVFRLLVKAGPEGLPAGEIAREIGAPASTLSTNLAILLNAGLVTALRDGRSIIYAAAYDRMRAGCWRSSATRSPPTTSAPPATSARPARPVST